jgi:hypothetical protein
MLSATDDLSVPATDADSPAPAPADPMVERVAEENVRLKARSTGFARIPRRGANRLRPDRRKPRSRATPV